MLFVSQYHHQQEVSQFQFPTPEAAASAINEGNASAAKGWRWGLSKINFIGDDGVGLPITEANAIRRSCGQAEY